jgi:hypothetical protein
MGQKKIKEERRRQREFEKAIARDESATDLVQRMNPDLYNQAKGMMTPEQIEEYKKMGEKMYNTVDFGASEILNNPDDPLAESVAYISEAIKSGLHPSFLDENEVKVMEDACGEEWYKHFGWDSLLME